MKPQNSSHIEFSSSEDPNGTETPPPKFSSHPSTISKNTNFELKILNNQFYGINREPSSITSHADNSRHQSTPSPSSEEEKVKMTRQFGIIVMAISYAMFLVTFAAILFIGNSIVSLRPVPQIFCLFMLFFGFLFFIFLLIDIRLHIMRTRKIAAEREKKFQILNEQFPQSDASSFNSLNACERLESSHLKSYDISTSPPHHNYCFVSGRHGELLYLKLGAAWFCFGLIIHSILSISYQIIYIRQKSPCADALQLTVDILFPLYSLFILFFIFKYCSLVINCKQSMAKFLLMHAMGTTLAFWIYSVVNETVNAINLKRFGEELLNSTSTQAPNSIHSHFDENPKTFSIDCPGPEELNLIYRYIEPYLYPFVVEFCILTVGIYFMMWSNINNCSNKKKEVQEDSIVFSSLESIPEAINTGIRRRKFAINSEICNVAMSNHEEEVKSSLIVYADCHASSRGLFAGMLLMIFKIVSMILVHVTSSVPQVIGTIVIVDRSIELLTLIIMIVTTIIAYIKTSKFDINHHPMSILDDVLLFIAIPAFFSETIFSMVPAIYSGSILNILVITAQLIQVLIQTPFIIDALRRCSNSPNLRKLKPGREIITFLTIANVALWIYYTFTIKTTDVRDERYEFYGDTLWSILNHLSLPLIMFYRFHASVCLVDIWKHSYERGESEH